MIDYCDMMLMPCGGIAYYDEASGISYRCKQCGTVVGSISQPQACKDQEEKWRLQKLLGGEGWDYFKDLEEWH